MKGPEARLRPLFKLLREVTDTADRLVLETENADDHVVRIQVAVLLRGINALKH